MMTLYKNMDTNQYVTTKDSGMIAFTLIWRQSHFWKTTRRKWAKVCEYIGSKVIWMCLHLLYVYTHPMTTFTTLYNVTPFAFTFTFNSILHGIQLKWERVITFDPPVKMRPVKLILAETIQAWLEILQNHSMMNRSLMEIYHGYYFSKSVVSIFWHVDYHLYNLKLWLV